MLRLQNIITGLVLAAFTGCLSPHGAYIADVDEKGWFASDKISVGYNNEDTASFRDINIIVRHSRLFRYDRLVLDVCFVSPSGCRWNDTVGIGIGTGVIAGDNYYFETEVPYRYDAVFAERGTYVIYFRPVMPENMVQGISALGVNIGSRSE